MFVGFCGGRNGEELEQNYTKKKDERQQQTQPTDDAEYTPVGDKCPWHCVNLAPRIKMVPIALSVEEAKCEVAEPYVHEIL